MPSMTLMKEITPGSKLHTALTSRLRARINYGQKVQNDRVEVWQRMEERTLAYVPLSEADLMRDSKRRNQGLQTYTTIQLPYSYSLLMSAHTYLTSVFFSRSPIHQFSGRHGETEQQIQALEATIAYQVEVGEMVGKYFIWMYDGLKYGLGVLGSYWDEEVIQYGQIQEIPNPETGEMEKFYFSERNPGYTGNRVYNVSPFDWISDPRVPVGRFQEGEFVCVLKKIPWSQILRRKMQGYYTNIEHIQKGEQWQGDNVNGSPQLKRPEDFAEVYADWGLGGDDNYEPAHPTTVQVYEMYVDLVPSEWNLGKSNYPEKWVFTLTNQKDLLIGAQPLGLAHGKFPFDLIETEVEGYALWNRGIPEIMEGVQNTMDWLINSHFYNVRAALNNQFIMDPSKIVVRDAEKGGPGFIYRLRPEAYGEDIRKFFMQVPVNDVTRAHLSDLNSMFGIGERVLGINDQIMGMLSGGGRKTATEIRTSTSFGTNRLKAIAEYISATAFAPHAQKLVQTTQQFYTAEQKFRLVGDLLNTAGPQFLNVDQKAIAGFYDFVPVDGTLPIDRFAQANLWKEILVNITRMPQIMMQYDLGKIFAWTAQLAGLKNINQFKVQFVPDQQLQMQAAAGNVVPMGQPKAGAGGPEGMAASGMSGIPQANQQGNF